VGGESGALVGYAPALALVAPAVFAAGVFSIFGSPPRSWRGVSPECIKIATRTVSFRRRCCKSPSRHNRVARFQVDYAAPAALTGLEVKLLVIGIDAGLFQ